MMKNFFSRIIFFGSVVVLVFLSAGVWAQRGGRGGGEGGGAPVTQPRLLTAYENADYGIKFPAPPGLSLFTPEQPGRFRNMFADRRIAYMVDLMGGSSAVLVRYLPNATEADMNSFRSTMDTNPPQAKLPDYKKLSVGMIKIGTAADKDAVEYVYTSREKDGMITTRQVVFVHKGHGFIFNCAAPEKDFASVNKKSFQPLFASIEFK